MTVDRVGAICFIKDDWLTDAHKVRAKATNHFFCHVGYKLTASSSKQENSDVLVAVLKPERNSDAKQNHFRFILIQASPPTENFNTNNR